MHKLDPNDMDALFRDGADRHEFTYNPDAWAMMAEKLDTKDRRKYFLWLFLGALLLTGIAGIYFLTNSVEQSNSIATKSNIEIANNGTILESIEDKDLNTLTEKENQSIGDSKLVVSEKVKQIENSSTINNRAQDLKSESKEEYIKTVSKVRSSNIGAQNSFQSENTGSLVDNEVVSVSSPIVSSISYNSTSSDETNIEKAITSTGSTILKDEISRDLLVLDMLKKTNNSVVLSINNKEQDFDLRLITQHTAPIVVGSTPRYVLTAFGSSDFSTVGSFRDPQTGYTVGAKTGIQLARKYQFDIGFAYSLKKYGSEGVDYNIEGGWNEMVGIDPTWMDGKGNVLQIPIEASYYFNGYESNSFFVNAGISSFLFNSEWYGFKYDDVELLNNPNATPIEEITMNDISRRNFHLAGIARLSVGYQKIISSNIAFELSPYLQVPLTGIGEGKVDLYTAGIQFAVKFNTK
jgi:hypothetical protein